MLTADRLPSQMAGVSERLRERFEAGLVATIKPPEPATRLAILRKRAALDGITLRDPSVLELIAERVTDNVRALEGALIRIVAHHSLTGLALDRQLALRVLDELHPRSGAPPAGAAPAAAILAAVCEFYGLTSEEICSAGRSARVAWPRQVAIHLTRELTDESLQEIGNAFGGRSHATVVHACNRVRDRTAQDPDLAAES